jgi:hypothetical protein
VFGRRDGKNRQVVGKVVVDEDMLPIVGQYVWTASPEGYAFRRIRETGGIQFLHYFVWEYHHPGEEIPDGLFLDHRNQDKRDNRIGNLEFVNARVKQANAPKHMDNTTGYKDVVMRPTGGFQARVTRDHVKQNAGSYASALEAAYAVNLAYEILHPEVPLPPNMIPQDALTEEEMVSVENNVRRLFRPDRQPYQP